MNSVRLFQGQLGSVRRALIVLWGNFGVHLDSGGMREFDQKVCIQICIIVGDQNCFKM